MRGLEEGIPCIKCDGATYAFRDATDHYDLVSKDGTEYEMGPHSDRHISFLSWKMILAYCLMTKMTSDICNAHVTPDNSLHFYQTMLAVHYSVWPYFQMERNKRLSGTRNIAAGNEISIPPKSPHLLLQLW
jgi:hypothetical protein